MKSNSIKIIIVGIIAAALGLGGGYLLFAKNNTMSSSSPDNNHQHETTTTTDDEIWTCSMHPQIRKPEPGDCPICGMDLILLEENTSNDPLVLEMTKEAVKLANIQTTMIGEQAGKTAKVIPLSGKVQADERLASSQVAHVPGRIEKLYISFTGEQVKVGQKLATIYSPDLITAQRELLEALKLQDLNPALIEAARNKLRFWKISTSTIDAIERNGSIQESFTLYAESAGIVTNRRISVGDYVKKGEALFDLMSLSKVWVLFDAYEEDLANFSVGDKIEFTAAAIPNKIFKTRISFIDPLINPNTRVVSIRTEISNARRLLKPEMFVSGTLKKKAKSTAKITIPKSAVLWTGKRSVVYVKVPDTNIPSFKFKEIEIGEALGNTYQVMAGLERGEEVVTYGSFTIDAAAQLNNQASMMNKKVGLKGEDKNLIPNFRAEAPTAFKKQLNALAKEYLLLKDAFVATDSKAAAKAAEGLTRQFKKVEMKLLKGDAHQYWMEQFDILKAHSKKIIELEDVEAQRQQFGFLSSAVLHVVEAFGTDGQVLYAQHCPMAFDNEGADWLASEEQIKNPYFGDKMMKCGLVKKTFTNEKK